MQEQKHSFASMAQRVAYTYLRSLADLGEDVDAGQRDLHGFFKAFYTALYENPAQFGLPELADDSITGEEGKRTQKLAELNRKLKKPRAMIEGGLDLLMLAGQKGQLNENMLLLDSGEFSALLKTTGVKKAFLSGLAGVGLEFAGQGSVEPGPAEQGPCVALRSQRFPAMLPALKALASACSEDAATPEAAASLEAAAAGLGRFNFARCDFRALGARYQPSALELYHIFSPEQSARAARLHEYFTSRHYKAMVEIHDIHAWLVQYQGNRQIKSTPLMQIEYAERFQDPLRVMIKCASANRVVPLLAGQPRFLQEDFFQRTYPCKGDACGWCKNRKTLGSSVFELDGVRKTICWYSNPEIKEFDDDAVTLIEQYAVLHEGLA